MQQVIGFISSIRRLPLLASLMVQSLATFSSLPTLTAAASSNPTPADANKTSLLTVVQVREVCARHQNWSAVRFQGVVTIVDPVFDSIVVQDDTGGITVRPLLMPDTSFVGHYVEVFGSPNSGAGDNSVSEATITDRGKTTLPAPQPLSAAQLRSDQFDGRMVAVSGVVSSVRIDAAGQLVLQLNAGGRYVSTRVMVDRTGLMGSLLDAEVTASGVAASSVDVDGNVTAFKLILPDLNTLTIRRGAPDPNLSPLQSVGRLGAMPVPLPAHRMRFRGTIRGLSDSSGLEFTDSSGSIRLRMATALDLSSSKTLDLAAFVVAEGGNFVLDQATVIGGDTSIGGVGDTALRTRRVLTKVEQLRKLRPDEARLKLPVVLDGVITYYDPLAEIMFFSDHSGSVFVMTRGLTAALPVKAGDRVHLTGTSGAGDFAPVVDTPKISVAGHSPLPPPISMNVEEIFLGRADSQWAELDGIVRNVDWESGRPVAMLAWSSEFHNCRAIHCLAIPETDPIHRQPSPVLDRRDARAQNSPARHCRGNASSWPHLDSRCHRGCANPGSRGYFAVVRGHS